MKSAASLVILLLCSTISFGQQVKEPTGGNPEWSKAYEPFRVAGNLYWVGTYDLGCYLITTPKGHILINTGLASSFDVIKSNVTSLGFKFNDIKILLTTQAHFDHTGALAAIKKATGASMMVDEKDVPVMEDGGLSDYAFGGSVMFEPVKVDKKLHDKDVIALGNVKLTMLHHPGHTKGSCSYLLDVKDEKKTYRVLIANMPSIVTDKHFDAIAEYPEIAKDYSYTLKALKSLSFDLWVASHASQFNLHKKRKAGDAYNPEAFKDREGYDKSLAELQAAYDKKMAGN
ncbi:subclass B3 metallo-beta-lactamase [Chryseolinea sp. T2]|uniref:subclass B3 metallo-beta-lactamase n=1 Tax=Chryseolinea sp. T2 TaxID=3129255 RepID=UPI003FCD78F9